MSHVWGLSLWCFPRLNPIPSSVGYSHCFSWGFFHLVCVFVEHWEWTWCSLVQQAESELFHELFIRYLNFTHLCRMMSLHAFFVFCSDMSECMFSTNPRFFSALRLNVSLGWTVFSLVFQAELCSWLLLLLCSVKRHVFFRWVLRSVKWLLIPSPTIQVHVLVPDYPLLT